MTIVSAKHVEGFVRGETLNIFLGILNESELDHLFEEEIDNIRREVIKLVDMWAYGYVLIYFITFL